MMRAVAAAPTAVLLACNPVQAAMLAVVLVASAFAVEYLLGWNRR